MRGGGGAELAKNDKATCGLCQVRLPNQLTKHHFVHYRYRASLFLEGGGGVDFFTF